MRWIAILISVFVLGCESKSTPADSYEVVTTTTMLADMVQELAGPDVKVRSLVPVGADPHLYQPTPADVRDVSRASLVVTNGLGLEGWIDDLVRNAGGKKARVFVATSGIEPLKIDSDIDPHFWFDVSLWSTSTNGVEKQLVELQIAPKDEVETRAASYRSRLKALDTWVKEQVAQLETSKRVLVTSHDAFHYFGRAYEFEVVGIQGVSTEQEASQRDVMNVIKLIRAREIPAVFAETSVNSGLVDQVSRETGVKVSGPLYSDSLGVKDSGAENYEGMVTTNVTMIVNALGGETQVFTQGLP